MVSSIALYTTVFPAVLPFLRAWFDSVRLQTDTDFTLFVGLDGLSPEAAEMAVGESVPAQWILSEPGDTWASLRQRAILRMISAFSAVVFVDSDDILLPTRIAAARSALETSDVNACRLNLVDVSLTSLNQVFPAEIFQGDIPACLPQANVVGLSNSAYRSQMLKQCLPIPENLKLIDWYLATRSWLKGAQFSFDPVPRMDYRQHPDNIARIRPPFEPAQLIRAAELVLEYYQALAPSLAEASESQRQSIEAAWRRVHYFYDTVCSNPVQLSAYTRDLNQLPGPHLWWSFLHHLPPNEKELPYGPLPR